MLQLDQSFLEDVGLGELPPEVGGSLLRAVYTELERRVGSALAAQMSDEQLTEFEAFIDEDNEPGAVAWLEENFSDYSHVVHERYLDVRAEVADRSESILAHFCLAPSAGRSV